MRVGLYSILIAALSAVTLAAAQPLVGDAAPDFTLRSLAGGEVTLSEFVADGPIALVVLRGYPGYQCPVCARQVHEFIQNADGFKQIGARVLFVYPGPSDDLRSRAEEFVEDKTFPGHFTMLIDPDYAFTNLYDLRWDAPRETAYPATFLMGRDRKIFYVNISDSHGGRTSAAEMIELLKAVK
jgi:peroxiredoxin